MFIIDSKIKKELNLEIFYLDQNSDLQICEELKIDYLHFDSRQIKPRNFFIALKGNRDGHNFILNAFENNAEGVVINSDHFDPALNELKQRGVIKKYIVVVKNTFQFLRDASRIQRDNFLNPIYAVLGSNGKTSTKDLLGKMLSFFYKNVYVTPGNWNNEIGLPLSLLNKPENSDVMVLELGMNHPGEIAKLSSIVKPDYVLIPSIGREHMEFFTNLEEVANAELEVIDFIKEGGYIFYPSDAPLIDWLKSRTSQKKIHLVLFNLIKENINFDDVETAFLSESRIQWKGIFLENQNIKHLGMLRNFYLGFLAIYLSQNSQIRKSLNEFIKYISQLRIDTRQRFQFYYYENTILIDDTYNANPDSFLVAIESMRNVFPEEKLACIAGHMAELGEFSYEGHKMIGKALDQYRIDLLAICGNQDVKFLLEGYKNKNVAYFESSEILATNLDNFNLKNYKAILIKGSRSAKMEIILKKILGNNYV